MSEFEVNLISANFVIFRTKRKKLNNNTLATNLTTQDDSDEETNITLDKVYIYKDIFLEIEQMFKKNIYLVSKILY